MVAIDTEMPKSCNTCKAKKRCSLATLNGWREDKRDDNCPLIEIGTCKDCKYFCDKQIKDKHWCRKLCGYIRNDFYCADFERRKDNGFIHSKKDSL